MRMAGQFLQMGLALAAHLEMESFACLSIAKPSSLGGSRPYGTFYPESLAGADGRSFDEWCIGALNFYSIAEQFESLREMLILIAGRADDHASNRKRVGSQRERQTGTIRPRHFLSEWP
jgi:hypothetical protein